MQNDNNTSGLRRAGIYGWRTGITADITVKKNLRIIARSNWQICKADPKINGFK